MTRHLAPTAALAAMLALTVNAGTAFAQTPPAPQSPVTTVMAMLKLSPGVQREDIVKVMPQEVRDTVQLYLDGRITQWYSRADGNGVMFMINCASAAEAKAITDKLPLVKAGLASFDFIPLTPLNPLRALIATPAGRE